MCSSDLAEYAGYNDVEIGFIVTACDEASTNILRHTYREDSGPIHYRIDLRRRQQIKVTSNC